MHAARRGAVAPARFVVFDVLAAGGTDLRTHPYRIRRALLLQLLDDAGPPLAAVPMTTVGEAARAWLTGHLDAGIEGVVAKRLDHGRLPARRAWRKVKTRTSTEAVVGGVLGPFNTPVALVLGRRNKAGRLRVAGRTGPLPRDVPASHRRPAAPCRRPAPLAPRTTPGEVQRRRPGRVHAGGTDSRRGTRRRRGSRHRARSARLAAPSHLPPSPPRPTSRRPVSTRRPGNQH